MSKCPECGKFLRNVTALVRMDDSIVKVEGSCKKHGWIETDDWCWDDFFSGDEEKLESEGT